MCQPPAIKNNLDATNDGCERQDEVPAAVDGAWHALLCQILVCGVHVLDGYETLHDVFKENANTEERGTARFGTLVKTHTSFECEEAVHVITSQLANQ